MPRKPSANANQQARSRKAATAKKTTKAAAPIAKPKKTTATAAPPKAGQTQPTRPAVAKPKQRDAAAAKTTRSAKSKAEVENKKPLVGMLSTAHPIELVRPDDLLVLRFSFLNLKLFTHGSKTSLVRDDPKSLSFIVVEFPPQSLVESVAQSNALAGAVERRISGPSQLVFRIPKTIDEVDYTAEGLLDWTKLDLCVAKGADLKGTHAELVAGLLMPTSIVHTEVEAPFGLTLSPHQYAGWAHSSPPVADQGRVELWHTRLGVKQKGGKNEIFVKEDRPDLHTVRAIKSSPDPVGFTPPLHATARAKLVNQMLDPKLDPIHAEQLMLSSLGAWLKVRGVWPAANIVGWQHRATMGRDHFVYVAEAGYLFPFGQRATKIEITERQFGSGGSPAFLHKRTFLLVQEPEKEFNEEKVDRGMPFKRVRLTTLETPNLLETNLQDKIAEYDLIKLEVGNEVLLFNFVAEDFAGQIVNFRAPLIFVSKANDQDKGKLNQEALDGLNAKYKKSLIELNNQKVAFTPTSNSGDTIYETSQLQFGAQFDENGPGPHFRPTMLKATARLSAIEQLTGKAGEVSFSYFDDYLLKDFDTPKKNAAKQELPAKEVFAKLESKLPVAFPVEKSGGLAAPNMEIGGLSRSIGVVGVGSGTIEDFVNNGFDPNAFLKEAKILGGLDLASIIADGSSPPEIKNRRTADGVETKLSWQPAIKESGPFKIVGSGAFALDCLTVTTPTGAEFKSTGTLSGFALDLAKIICINFGGLQFQAGKNKKLDFTATGVSVGFLGPLAFLNALTPFIAAEGFSDPPFLDITPAGVNAGYTLPLPPVAIGVMALENISLSAGLHLPFGGGPVRARFAFSERHHPFHLIVYGLGGGGFLGIAVGLDGVEMIEAALEFGGSLALNLGVASGGVSIMAGIYFKVEKQNGQDVVAFTGYLRADGVLVVLGLICVSVTFYLGLTYVPPQDPLQSKGHKVIGEATMMVKVEVMFFSKSVELTVRREFSNSNSFTFADVVSSEDWDDYCNAFAA